MGTFCPQCGTPIETPNWVYCTKCGSTLRTQKNVPPSNNLREAYGYFQHALEYFQQAYDSLRGAKGFSTWDIFGGGFFVDMMKHSRVDDARGLVNRAVENLKVGYQLVPQAPKIRMAQVHENDFVWDVLFDNIFSDLMAREKIQHSLQSVEEAIEDTQAVIQWISPQLG
jgi:hypothetical protein